MSLPELSIRRPVMTTLITLTFIIFGLFAYKQLPVSALPRVDFPTIAVTANLPGANAETMASSVAAPLERQFANIPGIGSMTSISGVGYSQITLQFDLDRSIDGAALDVNSSISAALRRLPAEMPTPPSYRKVNPADTPILFLALTSPTLPLTNIHDYAENVLAQQISQINGVAQVNVFGAQKYAVRIEMNPDALAARGLTLNEVRTAIAAANSNAPVGTTRGDKQNVVLQATGQMERAVNYRPLIVAWRGGAPVKLEDIANVIDSVEDRELASWYKNERSIILAVLRQSDGNTVEVIDKIKENIPKYQAQIPPSITLRVLSDRSLSIRAAVEDVEVSLMLSIVLVILVIFLFLKRVSATLIPTLALPVSLIGTFAFMYLFGYSIDNISLLALTLSVGFVVDDAIVMLENIIRYIEEGMEPFAAALKGSREIGFTIISITFSLVAVFIPVLLMSGVVGRIFREFAVTISVAILVSGFVSLTLTPMLCARMLSTHDVHKKPNALEQIVDGFIEGMISFYRVTLDFVLRFRFIFLMLTLLTGWVSLEMYKNIPKGFFPQEDTGIMFSRTESASDTSFAAMVEKQRQVVDIVLSDPAVDYVNHAVGVGGGPNTGSMFISLKPKGERSPAPEVINRLRVATAVVPGISTIVNPIQNLNLNAGRQSRSQYQYTLRSSDSTVLFETAPKLKSLMEKIPELRDVASDLYITNPQIMVDIDREKAASFGVTVENIRTTLNTAFGSREATRIYSLSTDYAVIMEADKAFQADPNALSRLYVRSSTGQSVSLDTVVTLKRRVGPLLIARQGQQPAVTLSFNLAPGVALGQAVEKIKAAEAEMGLSAAISSSFSGTAQLFQDSLKNQGLLLLSAVIVIYIILGVLYESFIHPITILSGLPSAGLGALLALKYYNMDLSVIAIIGILMLIGIVKKNAIMMVDFAITRRREGVEALPAIREAALTRFRPIMMTSLAAILGAVPIAIGAGAGAELRQPLGIAIVGGLIVSQILTLYITPVVYVYLDKIETKLADKKNSLTIEGNESESHLQNS